MRKLDDIRRKIDLMFWLVVLPLVGFVIFKKPITNYMDFPPLLRYVQHADFSWAAFIGLAIIILAVIVPFIIRIISSQNKVSERNTESRGSSGAYESQENQLGTKSSFPWWGWLGLGIMCVAWVLAWTRFSWFDSMQSFTFTPIWLGYIITINGLSYKRTGHCMLRDRPGYFMGLFVVSAVFWWYFEYLNRFVQNWYYEDIGHLSSIEYFIFATLPFSTVLPAVLGTKELLESIPRISAGLDDFLRIKIPYSKIIGLLSLIIFSASLAFIAIWPDYLFPLLWVSPLFIITSLQAAHGEKTIFSDIAKGNWRNIYLLALSALICGFCWELWNWHSLAKWIYAVPFVGRFKIFEMPILGYAGYLPFGLECAVIMEVVMKNRERGNLSADYADGGRMGEKIWQNDFGQNDEREERGTFYHEGEEGGERKISDAGVCRYGNSLIMAGLAFYFFVIPGFIVMYDLADPNLRGEGIPKIAWRLHRDLTPRYEKWARQRVASGKAGHLNLYDVPSTEWPMFGSVYYLWATEALQKAWEKDNSLSKQEPRVYARKTVEAAVDLILDPAHHSWVKTHWGEDYMHNENVFFRSLIIAGLTSHEKLIGDGKHTALLRDQVDTLAAELDASALGVLEDYPDECYPIDVLSTIACIQRADKVLGTDHSEFIKRSVRGFEGEMLDKRGLVPYLVDDETGQLFSPSRGVGNSYVLIFTPELWPDKAKDWYERYEKHFWQKKWWAAGFREYPEKVDPQFEDYMGVRTWYDVDAGPIIAGFSPAANAFGLAGAKVNGRLDHAYTLGTQIIAATWSLPNGTLFGPRILSSPQHAPYLGEACMLFFLAQQPHPSAKIVTGGDKPACVYFGLLFYFGTGSLILLAALRSVLVWRRNHSVVHYQMLQVIAWGCLLVGSVVLVATGKSGYGMIVMLIGQFLPRTYPKRFQRKLNDE